MDDRERWGLQVTIMAPGPRVHGSYTKPSTPIHAPYTLYALYSKPYIPFIPKSHISLYSKPYIPYIPNPIYPLFQTLYCPLFQTLHCILSILGLPLGSKGVVWHGGAGIDLHDFKV